MGWWPFDLRLHQEGLRQLGVQVGDYVSTLNLKHNHDYTPVSAVFLFFLFSHYNDDEKKNEFLKSLKPSYHLFMQIYFASAQFQVI